jgi:hypothetical protein
MQLLIDFNQIWIWAADSSNKPKYKKFRNASPAGAELLKSDETTAGNDEANVCLLLVVL